MGLPDHIGQSRLPLSFNNADAAPSSVAPPLTSVPQASSTHKDATQSFAYKVLQLLVFAGVDFLTPDFQPANVFHLVGSMLEGKVPMSSLEVSHAMTAPPTEEDMVAIRAKLAVEALSIFEANATSPPIIQPSRDQALISRVAYLSNDAARSTRERRGVCPKVVRLVNDDGVMVVGRTDGNSTRATP